MAVGIVRTNWAGTSGGPGLTQLAIREGEGAFWTPTQAQNAVNAVRTFWNALVAQLPNELTLTVSPVVDIYNEVDAELTASEIAPTAPANVVGTSAAVYNMASGIKVNWNTGVIRNGHRVKGSTFIVPAASTVFNTSGVVDSTVRTTVNTAANALISGLASSGLELVVWSRPVPGIPGRPGALALVATGETNEKSAVLRGRRD